MSEASVTDIPADSAPPPPPNYICACKSVATDSNIYSGEIYAGRVQL